ncbi:MAG TPA: MerR family transcriptional regulator [Rubrobacteraceae bacterium]|nr:MerR family transcriptional regulator [Rubrobacteraceae bacterium]
MDDVIEHREEDGSRPVAVWKVGELAERTGLSVRTLHYYDEIGLLSPSRRTAAGHRLYTAGDVVRLQQIRSLKHLGFGLEEIQDCLDRPEAFPLRRVVKLHLSRLEEQIELRQKLRDHLEVLATRLDSAEEVSVEGFVKTAMEVIEMSERIERYYTPEQLEYLEQRRRELGEERIRASEEEWPELIEQVRAEMEAGTDPADERVQLLAQRWIELIQEFTGGDPGIERSLGNMWRQEESIHGMETGPMRELGEYVSRALAASERSE